MNQQQLKVMWVGIVAVGLLALFPPQLVLAVGVPMSDQSVPLTLYTFIFSPPAGAAGIDWPRFWLPVVPVCLATVGAILTLRPQKPGPDAAARKQKASVTPEALVAQAQQPA